MSNTVKRIKEFIDFKGISVRKFEEIVGFSNGSFASQYKNNKTIGVDKVENILHFFPEISPEWLLTGEGEMLKPNMQEMWSNNMTTKTTTFSEETKNIKNVVNSNEPKGDYSVLPKVVTVDKQGNDNIVLVPNKAAAGYLAGYGDTTFIKSLPTYNLPNISNGTFRMFQVAGDSMEPTIQNQSYVVGEWKENWNEDIKDGRVYIFVIQSFEYEGILVKRALNRIEKYGNVLLKSDNRIYGTKTFTPEEIKEVWEVKLYLSFNIPDPATIYDRMNDLEARLIELEQPKKRKN